MFPWTNLADEPKARWRYHQALVVAVDGVLHDPQPALGVVTALDGQGVDGDVEARLERHHLGPLPFHEVGQVAGGRAELEHAPARQVDPAEVVGLVAPQVPGTWQHPAVGQLGGVVPGEVAEVRPLTELGELRLVRRVQLSQVVARWVVGQQGPAFGRGRRRGRLGRTARLGVASAQHGPSLYAGPGGATWTRTRTSPPWGDSGAVPPWSPGTVRRRRRKYRRPTPRTNSRRRRRWPAWRRRAG